MARTTRKTPVRKAAVKAKPTPVSRATLTSNGKIRAEVVQITPALAEEWLGRNSHNRGLRNATVERLAGAIRRDEWRLNGDSIRWSADGSTLLDGQHRLWAVVEAGKPITSLVVYGIEDDAQATMDVGDRRNLRDVLKLRGDTGQAARIAATLVTYWKRTEGLIRGPGRPTIAQALALLDEHPGLRDAAGEAEKLSRRFRVSVATCASAWYEFSLIDGDALETFWNELVTGVGLDVGSPVLALRTWLELQSAAGAGARANAVVTYAMLIKAWNAYRAGRHVEKLAWRPVGKNAEPFPEPR